MKQSEPYKQLLIIALALKHAWQSELDAPPPRGSLGYGREDAWMHRNNKSDIKRAMPIADVLIAFAESEGKNVPSNAGEILARQPGLLSEPPKYSSSLDTLLPGTFQDYLKIMGKAEEASEAREKGGKPEPIMLDQFMAGAMQTPLSMPTLALTEFLKEHPDIRNQLFKIAERHIKASPIHQAQERVTTAETGPANVTPSSVTVALSPGGSTLLEFPGDEDDTTRLKSIRDDKGRKGSVPGARIEVVMPALVYLHDHGHQDTLQWLYRVSDDPEAVNLRPREANHSLDVHSHILNLSAAEKAMAGANFPAGILTDGRLNPSVLPIIRAALRTENNEVIVRNPIDLSDPLTAAKEATVTYAKTFGFNQNDWRDKVEPPPPSAGKGRSGR